MNWFKSYIAVLRRELKFFAIHKTFFILLLALPLLSFVFFVLIFKSGVPSDMPVAVLDADNTSLSRQLTRMIDATPGAKVKYNITNMDEGETMMKKGSIDAIIQIPQGLEKNVYSNTQANVIVYINGLNLMKNGILNKDLQTVLISFSSGVKAQILVKKGMSEHQAAEMMMPIYFEKHILFNPYINYSYYLLPTFLPLMLMFFTILSTVFTIGVELKNSTAKEWFETAGGNPFIALVGKLTPHSLIFFTLCMLIYAILFRYMAIPMLGSEIMIFISGFIYILSCQSIGVFLVTLLSNMRLALSIGGGYSVLSFTFSGLTFPFMAMGTAMHIIGDLFPLTFYTEIFIDQAMHGAPVANSMHFLLSMMLFLLLPLIMLPRLNKICTNDKYWGKL